MAPLHAFMVFLGVTLVLLVHNTQRDYFEARDRIMWILWFLIEVVLIGILIFMSLDYGTRFLVIS